MFTGYLANWNMFEPRKLIPLSMELWRAPIAVITEITENTPMVMPVMVSAARSLFAPNDDQAISTISRNSIVRIGVMECWSNGVVESQISHLSIFGHHSITPPLHHSYLSAVTGSSREADQAGAKPENSPVMIETTMLVMTRPRENLMGNDGAATPIRKHIP